MALMWCLQTIPCAVQTSPVSKELSCSPLLELQMLARALPLALTWPQGEFGSETSFLSSGSLTSLKAVSTGGVPVSCACETSEHLRCFRLLNTAASVPSNPSTGTVTKCLQHPQNHSQGWALPFETFSSGPGGCSNRAGCR